MKVEIEIPEERIRDLLCNAFEGGSNYWYVIEEYHYPNRCRICDRLLLDTVCCSTLATKQTKESLMIEFPHIELPFKCGFLTIGSHEDEKAEKKELTLEAIKRGVRVMANKYPNHFVDFISGNDDATTGDIFLQCSLFGKIIYS